MGLEEPPTSGSTYGSIGLTQHIVLDGQASDPVSVLSGVPQHQHHKQVLFDYSLHNQTLENVQSAKYFGITITDNMDWGQMSLKYLPKQLRHLVFAGT